MSAVASEYELTAHELRARELYATKANKPSSYWAPVRSPERETWYDWADPATGQVGQCRLGPDGAWHQDPRGTAPVVLEYRPRQKDRAATSKPAAPRERPIIFTGESVRAILEGRKSQSRRVVKGVPTWAEEMGWSPASPPGYASARGRSPEGYGEKFIRQPFPKGMRLWCKETWAEDMEARWEPQKRGAFYKADPDSDDTQKECEDCGIPCDWKSPIFMPRWASRITLELTSVRVERVQDISEADAIAEGVKRTEHGTFIGDGEEFEEAKTAFAFAWDGINDRRAPWDSNPWVWALTFRVIGGAG